ncbi:MAG TPA: glycosyltransferase family 87 protein [Paraburkholderia sp.]
MATTAVARLSAPRVRLYAAVFLTIQCIYLAISVFRYYGLADRAAPMVGADFVIFWSAARVALEHGAPAVFSPHWMRPMESALWRHDSFAPWPYPPTFLLAVIPFGLLSFGGALLAFLGIGIAAYGAMLSRIVRQAGSGAFLLMIAFPGVAVAIVTGQNSLLTAAAAGVALVLLPSSPLLAGACIAVLAIKPQFGVLFPVALICARQWRALLSAGLCSLAIAGVSAVAFGRETWGAFATFLPEFNRIAVEHGRELWGGMPTVFAAARLAGLPVGAAYVAYAIVALPAAIAMVWVWIRDVRFELRAAALVVATLLVQPYFMYYDLAWLALPIAFVLRDAERVALSRADWVVLAVAWLTPAAAYFAFRFDTPVQVTPVVLIGLLVVIVRRAMTSRGIG